MGFLDNYRMKAKREQIYGELMVIKLFASNYTRDLLIEENTLEIQKCN
jgi:hypothetical protein